MVTTKSTHRETGKIIPRAFGVTLNMPGNYDLFESPVQHALAQLALETRPEIIARLGDWSERHSQKLEDVAGAFVEGVVKKEKTKNILNNSRRTLARQESGLTLQKVKHYGGSFRGQVKSRGDMRDNKGYRSVSLVEPFSGRDVNIGYPDNSCGCGDHQYGRDKGKQFHPICMHLAALEIALFHDENSQMSQSGNMTGLNPSERRMKAPLPKLPFTINMFKSPDKMSPKEKEVWQLTTDLLVKYYVDGESQYKLSAEALENPLIYSLELIKAIQSPKDRAEFRVLRQDVEKIAKSDLSPEEDRRHAAVTSLIKSIEGYLADVRDSHPARYCREFVGTKWETVARRFESRGRGPVYSVVVSNEHPPLIVARRLGEKSSKWFNSYDPVQTDDLARKIDIPYSQIDDVTRRESTVQLILPEKALASQGIHIPGNLKREYDDLRVKMGERKQRK